ncbi:MAG TPA: hypothetical protein VHK26_07385 [Methyloceanibacter sp.]|nr:hypothetical protein [Methyloceanibacter sp.]
MLELFVADAPDASPASHEPFRRLSLSEVGLSREELHRRYTMYDAQSLASSIKGTLLAACLERTGGPALLLDADTLVLGALDDLCELTARHAILLTPHASVPLQFAAGEMGLEQSFLRAGIFNGGFVGVSRGADAFLRWWSERCARDCIHAPDRGLFYSQNWLGLVPALFDHHVLRDRGINLTGLGMGEDDIGWREGRPWIGDRPVRLFHFAGKFDPHSGCFDTLRDADWWPRVAGRPGFARLCQDYARRLLRSGFDGAAPVDHSGFDWVMRAAYRQALLKSEANGGVEPPNPFAHGMAAFTEWLARPANPGSRVSRYLAALYSERPDLRAAFPNVPGDGEGKLLAWVASKYGGKLPRGLPTEAAL